MRVTLSALPTEKEASRFFHPPVILQIRPSRGGEGGAHWCRTNSHALRGMLKRRSGLPGSEVERFLLQLEQGEGARLSEVELGDGTLRELGFLLD